MALEELKEKAVAKVQADNPDSSEFKSDRVYEHFMDGTLITVKFHNSASGKEDSNHVHFGKDDVRVYRWHSDALSAVSNYKERLWFFRFLEVAGIGGVIAFVLILVFSGLLCALAFSANSNKDILEVIKLSFTVILGYFFGQTTASRK